MDAIRNQNSKRGIRLVSVAFFLQILGYVTPGWYINEFDSHYRDSYGVWYLVRCRQQCRTVSLVSKCKSVLVFKKTCAFEVHGLFIVKFCQSITLTI